MNKKFFFVLLIFFFLFGFYHIGLYFVKKGKIANLKFKNLNVSSDIDKIYCVQIRERTAGKNIIVTEKQEILDIVNYIDSIEVAQSETPGKSKDGRYLAIGIHTENDTIITFLIFDNYMVTFNEGLDWENTHYFIKNADVDKNGNSRIDRYLKELLKNIVPNELQ